MGGGDTASGSELETRQWKLIGGRARKLVGRGSEESVKRGMVGSVRCSATVWRKWRAREGWYKWGARGGLRWSAAGFKWVAGQGRGGGGICFSAVG